MPFKKGQSGNPGGRPKMAPDLLELLRARIPKNIANLEYWADQREDGNLSLRASLALHEMYHGKPVQQIGGIGPMGDITIRWAGE